MCNWGFPLHYEQRNVNNLHKKVNDKYSKLCSKYSFITVKYSTIKCKYSTTQAKLFTAGIHYCECKYSTTQAKVFTGKGIQPHRQKVFITVKYSTMKCKYSTTWRIISTWAFRKYIRRISKFMKSGISIPIQTICVYKNDKKIII